ncbi:hemagglutinin repeat-containing protein [Paraburkholderia antibiotica]|uniref:Filamentous hemagglutinin N-terminal domain-containing protein n=1 Tax=Paraburkholderia antibiotica TaxID=2728839 RepID=A0A7X9X379_9BURK|nr:hemagglutinin repeat-containing protein [Paraburkholderia antibiotica]NML30424.1 filamentous hemagglutinin N-terminal domain-containing protein [Paraburkholderia antibiotica]
MNTNTFRLVFSRFRGMLVAVAETATGYGKSNRGETRATTAVRRITLFAMRHAAFAALALAGFAPALSDAQIVPSGAHAPGVLNTANGLPQVNINKPSGAGVSLNTYSQFDVQKNGAILNNSPVITGTQQAGQINGNPNFGANDAAKIIVNQVNSNNPSLLRGYVEVAGQKANVVISNASGIVVDGGGFINTTRGILTTGNPLIDGNGNLTGFNVTGGTITVQGDGFNASDIDQVDLIARAVQANAAIYANTLNVVTGANNVDYASLNATPIAGTGAAPGVSIDVSQLGGMYANWIVLVGTENGVGVANAGKLAAQAGDLTLTASGQLVNTGKLTASGNLGITAGSIANSGTIAAQQDTTINAGSVASTGLLGAGVNSDGTLGTAGNLSVTSAGLLSATGQTIAAGSVTLYGVSLDLTGAQLSAVSALALTATGGDLALAGAQATAGSTFTANAAGTLDTSSAKLGSGGAMQLSAASINSASGQVVSGSTLNVQSAGALDNRQGILQAAGQGTVAAGSVDDTGGQILSLNSDGLTLSASGALTNGAGGVIGGNGDVSLTAGTVTNAGEVSALGNVALDAQTIRNDGGTAIAGGTLTARANGALSNVQGQLSGADVTVSGTSIDNTSGQIVGTQVAVSGMGTLTNRNGAIVVDGADGALAVTVSGIDNTAGTIANTGTGATTATATTVTNTGGVLGGNGDVTVNAQTLTNDSGAQLVAAGAANLNVTNQLDNAGGLLYGGTALNLNQPGAALDNTGGAIEGGQDVSLAVASMTNTGGTVSANRDISVSGALLGGGAMIAGRNLTLALEGDFATDAASVLHADNNLTLATGGTLTNTATLEAGNALTLNAANVVNAAGADINAAATTLNASGAITNAGTIEGDAVTTNSASLTNTGAVIGNNVIVNATDVTNDGAQAVIAGATFVGIYAVNSLTNADAALIYSGGNMELARDSMRDSSGLLANQTGTITNSGSTIEAAGDIDVAAHTLTNERTGVVTEAGTPVTTTGPTLTFWSAGIPVDQLGTYRSLLYEQWNIIAGAIGSAAVQQLAKPITVTLPADQVTNIDTSAQTFSLTTPLTDVYRSYAFAAETETRVITNNATQYYQSLTQNADGTVTIAFYPDYDPAVNIAPDQVRVNTTLGSDGHDYVELSRTATTTTTTDQLINAGTAATIQAQGSIRVNADGGTIDNQSSTMAAGGDLVRRATGGAVNDTGTLLQQTGTETDVSTFYWHQKTGDSTDTQTVNDDAVPLPATTVASLPAIATAGQAVQTNAADINIGTVDRVGQTVTGAGPAVSDATGTLTGSRPQTLGNVGDGIPGLTLPANALYSYNTAPGASYLVETDSRFTSYTKFISSDYMLAQLGLNPQQVEKRVGDGMYEEQLVMNQITQLTGRTFLGGYTSNLDEYTALMSNGVQSAQAFNLTVGIGLTDAQMAALTTDIVWLVNQTVTLPDGTTQTVLVPKLYLAQSNTVDLQDSGALVAGHSVSLNSTGDVTNSGHVAGDVATTVIGNNVVNRGVIGSGGTTTVAAVQDVTNLGGRIGGVDTVVSAGRDIVNESSTAQASVSTTNGGFYSNASGMAVQSVGTISASGSATLAAGRDVTINGASVQSGGDTTIAAGRDINVGTTTLTATQDAGTTDGLNGGHTTATHNVGSTITTGGNLVTASGGNTTLTDAQVQAGGDATLVAGGNLTVTAAKDTVSYNGQSMGGSIAHHKDSTYDETAQGSNINAGGNATLAAGQSGTGNLSVLGSSVTTGGVNGATGGGVTLQSAGDITVGAVTETHDADHWSQTNHSNVLSSEKVTDTSTSHQVASVGSLVSGDSVAASAAHDLNINGSTVAATNDLTLSAGHDLNITTTQDTSQGSTTHEVQASGFGAMSGGGASINYGTREEKDNTHDSSVTHNGSLVGSTNGSVTMSAGNDLHITGSDVIAAQDVTGTGTNVIIDAATNTSHHDDSQEMKQSGFTLGLAGSIGDAINGAVQQGQAIANGSGDARATALHSIAAAGDAAIAVAGLTGGALAGKNPTIGVQLSFGTSSSKNTFSEDQTSHTGSTVQAGGTTTFAATGDGTAGSGNLTIAGSNVSANDVILAAKNQVNIVNTTDTDTTASTNRSSSASVGISYTNQGFGVSASMANAHGDANSDAAIQNNSHVTGANSVTIVSGGDTNIIGSDVAGGTVNANVGGNLNVQSVQDTTVSTAHQSSVSGGFSISQGGGSASFSAQNGHADSNYAQVKEQAGILAGDGGFNINVKGNTDLKGAVIASTAEAEKNSLTTGTLTFSNIENESHYSAASNGISAGGGIGVTGKAIGEGSVSGSGAPIPMISQDENGDESATTRSAISTGAINITNQAAQTQDVATLSRDTTDTNGTVSATPDVSTILSQQADVMQAAQAAGQVVAQGIGAYADMKRDEAKAAGDTATANAWDEGGTNRTALHIAGGALMGGLGGGGFGSAAAGAAGAGIAAWTAGDLNRLANGTRDALGGGDAAQMAGNVLSNVIAGAGGFLIGGTAGAFTASNADLYNRSTGNGDGQGSTANSAVDTVSNSVAGVWNGLVSIGEMIANTPNGGPFASPGDPGYISADGLRLPYTAGDQVGPGVEFFAAALATKGAGKGATAEAKALSEAEAFERSLVNLPPGERVAQVKQTAQTVATDNGWTKDSQLSRINGRDVYRADDGTLYAVDSQHGRFEQVNGRTGAHMGEVSMLDLQPTKPADTSGQHDLKLK